jgi:hypothetical protein
MSGHPVGKRQFLLHFEGCVVRVDFEEGTATIYTAAGDILCVNEHDGIDWRTILKREREIRRAELKDSGTGTEQLLKAVDTVLHGWDVLADDAAVANGWQDDGRAG